LVDGGVLNPVPIAPTFNDATDMTIAVNLGGPLTGDDHAPQLPIHQEDNWSKFQKEIKTFIGSYGTKGEDAETRDWGMYEVADKAFDTMQSTIARLEIAAYPPDINIEIARNACGTLEFDRAEEMIQLGYEKAQQAVKLTNNRIAG
jgi:NTE family protein